MVKEKRRVGENGEEKPIVKNFDARGKKLLHN
jgi:hypothetical protein